mgnify:CR=1 FL=1
MWEIPVQQGIQIGFIVVLFYLATRIDNATTWMKNLRDEIRIHKNHSNTVYLEVETE